MLRFQILLLLLLFVIYFIVVLLFLSNKSTNLAFFIYKIFHKNKKLFILDYKIIILQLNNYNFRNKDFYYPTAFPYVWFQLRERSFRFFGCLGKRRNFGL